MTHNQWEYEGLLFKKSQLQLLVSAKYYDIKEKKYADVLIDVSNCFFFSLYNRKFSLRMGKNIFMKNSACVLEQNQN